MNSVEAAVLGTQLKNLHDDVGEIKVTLSKLSDTVVALVRIDTKQAEHAASLERAFATIEAFEMKQSAATADLQARIDAERSRVDGLESQRISKIEGRVDRVYDMLQWTMGGLIGTASILAAELLIRYFAAK